MGDVETAFHPRPTTPSPLASEPPSPPGALQKRSQHIIPEPLSKNNKIDPHTKSGQLTSLPWKNGPPLAANSAVIPAYLHLPQALLFRAWIFLFAFTDFLYSLARHFFLAESVLVADPEQRVSRTEGRPSRSESRNLSRL